MPRLIKLMLTTIALLEMTFMLPAQDLEYLPPVLPAKIYKDSGVCLLLNTLDFARAEHKSEKKPYVYSIQIVDADRPWPPRWYTAKSVYTDEMYNNDVANHTRHVNFIENPEINGNYIFYLQIFPLNKTLDPTKTFDVQHSAYLAVLDTGLNLVDSIACGRLRGGPYSAGFRQNNNIEILTILRRDSIIDWRRVSGNQSDSAVDSEFGIIRILDTRDNVKWSWSPLEHLNPKLFKPKEKLAELQNSAGPGELRDIRWMKLSSIAWDYDGDILYGIENVGIGKISRKDGHVLWQVNYMDSPRAAHADTMQCYSPYDFKMIYNDPVKAVYSFYERGNYDLAPPGRGVVFEVNKSSQKIKLLKYLEPHLRYASSGHGGFDYDYTSGRYVIDYGVFDHTDTLPPGFWTAFEYGRKDDSYASYDIPLWNYTFGVHRLDSFPAPERPVIVRRGSMIETADGTTQATWYILEGPALTSITKIGAGPSIKAMEGATYCVARPFGAGYTVSYPYTVGKKSK